jgi:small GTP-binding protein
METHHVKTKVCLVGDPAVGKTALARRFVLDEFSDRYLTTIGTKVTKKEVRVERPAQDAVIELSMSVWDIMGQEGFRELLRDAYFIGAHGVLAVADLTRRETLDNLPAWIDAVDRTVGVVPVVVALNKADLADRAAYDRAEARRIVDALHADCFLTSAKTGENVEAAFRCLGERVIEQLHTLAPE